MAARGPRLSALFYTARVAERARLEERQQNVPTYDPVVVERAYAAHRAKRHAQIRRKRARRYAGARFFVFMLLLLGLCVFLALTVWREIERLFGL
jgi:hypothetical protein